MPISSYKCQEICELANIFVNEAIFAKSVMFANKEAEENELYKIWSLKNFATLYNVHITCTFTVQLKKCTVSAFMNKLFVHVFRNLAKYGQSPVPVTSISIQQNTLYSM